MRRPGRRGKLWVVALLVVTLVVVAVAAATRLAGHDGEGIAGRATVSVSSAALGSSPRQTVTGEDLKDPRRGWLSMGETTGAWLELEWSSSVKLHRVILERNPLDEPGVTVGFLTFSDGSDVYVRLSTTDRTTVVAVAPRQVQSVRFTVSEVSKGARASALTRVRVDDAASEDDVATDAPGDGDVAGSASITSSTASTSESLRHLVADDSTATGSGTTFPDPARGWIQLNWAKPRELTTIAVAGASGTTGLRSGTLLFSDGSKLTLGDVLDDGSRPTVIAFMPRATTSLRLTFDTLDGPGALTLGRLSTYQRSAPPLTAHGAATEPEVRDRSLNCDQPRPRPSDAIGLVVACPTTGAVVAGDVTVTVAVGRSYNAVSAAVWPADPSVAAPPELQAVPDEHGEASFALDLGDLPAGPFTVRFEATSGSRRPASVLFQMYHGEGHEPPAAATSEAARGRSLVYDEEFDKPLSVAPTGQAADYASKKPEAWGGSEFGDAIFADPSSGLGNLRVVDDRYLKVSVQPRPAELTDPSGSGREHVGGLIASARPGGSGFSAQYGYFEARMLVPAAPGTWPAFWAMPSANLVEQQAAVAEIDAVELYGHDPTTACHATHGYVGDKDNGEVKCLLHTWDTTQEAMSWHTYGMSVSPNAITFYVDGQPVHTAPQVPGGAEPLFFMVDLALGGGWPVAMTGVQDRADLYVDYVRVFV